MDQSAQTADPSLAFNAPGLHSNQFGIMEASDNLRMLINQKQNEIGSLSFSSFRREKNTAEGMSNGNSGIKELDRVLSCLDEAELTIASGFSCANEMDMEPTPLGVPGARNVVKDNGNSLRDNLCVGEEDKALLAYVLNPLIDQPSFAANGQFRKPFRYNNTESSTQDMPLTAVTYGKQAHAESSEERFRSYQCGLWQQRFNELAAFRNEHGHCRVPYHFPENQQLAQWIKRQRYQYKQKKMNLHSTLTDERQAALEKLGFVWDSHSSAWLEQFESLKRFHARYGNCSVPSHYVDKSLAIWVKSQRRHYKLYMRGSKSTLTPERFIQLERLGFDWNPRNL